MKTQYNVCKLRSQYVVSSFYKQLKVKSTRWNSINIARNISLLLNFNVTVPQERINCKNIVHFAVQCAGRLVKHWTGQFPGCWTCIILFPHTWSLYKELWYRTAGPSSYKNVSSSCCWFTTWKGPDGISCTFMGKHWPQGQTHTHTCEGWISCCGW